MADGAGDRTFGALAISTGSMFAGKTEELIRRVRQALYARPARPGLQTRSGHPHGRDRAPLPQRRPVRGRRRLYERGTAGGRRGPSTDVVAIEEAQFFDEGIVDVCNTLADRGRGVIVSGPDMDFRDEPFGPMPALLDGADEVVKLQAICARCGRDASCSQRLTDGKPAPAFAPTILVGAQESYEARCRHCHEV